MHFLPVLCSLVTLANIAFSRFPVSVKKAVFPVLGQAEEKGFIRTGFEESDVEENREKLQLLDMIRL